MQFLYPSFLWALGLIAIPILIHLFNLRRYKRVQFTNVKHLKEIQQQTKRNKNIRQLLILASRILAISSLVFLFAQPFIPKQNQQTKEGQSLITLYIDNSFSMLGESSAGPLLEVAKAKSNEILKAHPETDRFQIISNEFKPNSSRFLSRLDAQAIVDEIQISSVSKDLSHIVKKIHETEGNLQFDQRQVYLLTDFQNNKTEALELDSTTTYTALPLRSERKSNLSIDSVWFTSPFIKKDEPLAMKVKLSNHGSEDLESIALKLLVEGQQKLVHSIDMKAGSSQAINLSFSVPNSGWKMGQIQIEDYPIQFDNDFFFTFNVRKEVKILEIFESERSDFLYRLYASDSYFNHSSLSKNGLDYSSIPDNDLIILNGLKDISSGLNQVLLDFVTNGGSLSVIPNEDANAALKGLGGKELYRFGEIMNESSDVVRMDVQHPLFDQIFETVPENIDLPKVLKSFAISSPQVTFSTILRMSNQQDFLAEVQYQSGRIFLLASPLNKNWSNFQEHALFVPLYLKMSFAGASQLPHYYEIGSNALVQLGHSSSEEEALYKIKNSEVELTAELIVNDNRVYLNEGGELSKQGVYDIVLNDSSIQKLALNYSRTESGPPEKTGKELSDFLENQGLEVIDNLSTNISQLVKESRNGNQLWRWFALLSLFFLAIEILLLRFWPKG